MRRGAFARLPGTDGAPANAPSYAPAISGDGRFVIFISAASNLVADGNKQLGVFRATIGAASSSARRLSVTSGGQLQQLFSKGGGHRRDIKNQSK